MKAASAVLDFLYAKAGHLFHDGFDARHLTLDTVQAALESKTPLAIPWKIVRGAIGIITGRWRMPIASPKHAGEPALVAIGAAIRETRKVHGISQEDLAHRSDVDRSYLSSIERGTQNPGVMTLVRIATAIGVSLEELMRQAGL